MLQSDFGQLRVNKEGQTVMLYDVGRHYPRAYFHRHSQVKKDPSFTTQGANEVYEIIQRVGLLVKPPLLSTSEEIERENVAVMLPRKIYNNKPHITADNHFSGDTITNYLGKNGFGYMCTTQQDLLPADINKQYLNHIQQNDTSSSRLKVAQYEQPIVAVKRVNSMLTTQAYTKVITSLQSTGTTNFTSVNSLPSCCLFV